MSTIFCINFRIQVKKFETTTEYLETRIDPYRIGGYYSLIPTITCSRKQIKRIFFISLGSMFWSKLVTWSSTGSNTPALSLTCLDKKFGNQNASRYIICYKKSLIIPVFFPCTNKVKQTSFENNQQNLLDNIGYVVSSCRRKKVNLKICTMSLKQSPFTKFSCMMKKWFYKQQM